jgi:anaerobic selenocysteine-containing dehydrogenase
MHRACCIRWKMPAARVPVITFNPLRERGLERFVNPQSPKEMITLAHTDISSQYVQIKIGGDTAAAIGMAKRILERDDRARAEGLPRLLDQAFIDEHTSGFEEFAVPPRALQRAEIERHAGVPRRELELAADTSPAPAAPCSCMAWASPSIVKRYVPSTC